MTDKYKIFNPGVDALKYSFEYNKQETESLHGLLNGKADISLDDLRKVSLWKTNRVLGVSDEVLDMLSGIAQKQDLKLEDVEVKEVIEALVDSQGVGYPMASAILKFIRPNVFPIIDVRAYRALTGEKITYSKYSFEIYKDYVLRLMSIADQCEDLELRDVDEQLYCFDKDKNNGI